MFEELFDRARQSMTTDSACDCGLTKDTKIKLSQIKDDCTDDARRTYKVGERSQSNPDMIKTANGWRRSPQGKNGNSTETASGASEGKKDAAYMDNKGLQAIYRDIKNNGLEHLDADRIAKEYKITKGDAEKIKAIMNVAESKKDTSPSERPDEVDPEIPGSGAEHLEKVQSANDFFENMRNALKSGNAPKRDESSDDFFARMRNQK